MEKSVLDALFQKYYNEAKLYAFTLCKDVTLAEEFVSEAFYRALRAKDMQEHSFKYWLLRVCRNLWIDHLRRKKRHTELNENHADGNDDSVADKLIKSEEYAALYKAIAMLSEPYRETVILFYFEKLKISDISELTERTQDSVKVILYRAREKLKKLLEV